MTSTKTEDFSMDALVLSASREISTLKYMYDSHLNGAIASAAYKMGVRLTPEQADAALQQLTKVAKRTFR